MPRERGVDHTLAFLREGYRFIGNRCRRYGSDIFETRLMLRRVVCMQGPEAAELVYTGDRFTRVGAMPPLVLRLLQDIGSVQQLDGAEHRHRKDLFLKMGQPTSAAILAAHMAREWKKRLGHWQEAGRIVLFDEVTEVIARATAAWAGLRLNDAEAKLRTKELSEMVEATGAVGPRKLRALLLRRRCERWAQEVIRQVRAGELPVAADSAVGMIASYQNGEGEPLDVQTAAVELLNVLRPTVAVGHFIVFAALALHEHSEVRQRIVQGDDDYLSAFVEEVRRTSPFFPFVGGRAREEIEWRDIRFAKDAWVLLDLYGTNRDSRAWPDPDAFMPERFLLRPPSPFEHIPQGAGEVESTHRCPGEPITIALMKTAARLLSTSMRYEVPPQDLSVDLTHIPALPKSGFVISDISEAH
ncbi:MAG: cytochrome P450 [Rhodospirillales bacterium]|nr:cytochrome P450 [Rhodospirillales bacterium]